MDIMKLYGVISNPSARDICLFSETAFHHEGDPKYLQRLVQASVSASVDAVKFQVLLRPEAAYSQRLPHFENIRRWCLNPEQWKDALASAKGLGLETVLMPIDPESVDFALENESLVDAIEVHSVWFNDCFMLKSLQSTSKPILLNIGGRQVGEIAHVLELLAGKPIGLLYGLQAYPTDPATLCLGRVSRYRDLFGLSMGYADHTDCSRPEVGTAIACYAYLLGCRMFERHIAVEPATQRVDFQAAVMPSDIRAMRSALEAVQSTLGNDSLLLSTPTDQTYRKRQKQIVFARNMKPGEVIQPDALAFLVVPELGDFEQMDFPSLIGRTITKPTEKGLPVRLGDITGVSSVVFH
jgi:N,N'-diacetyllegionaminate synthase